MGETYPRKVGEQGRRRNDEVARQDDYFRNSSSIQYPAGFLWRLMIKAPILP